MEKSRKGIFLAVFLAVIVCGIKAQPVFSRPHPAGAEDIDNEVKGQLIDVDLEFSTIKVRQYADGDSGDYQDWTFYVSGNSAIRIHGGDTDLENLSPKSWVVVHYSVMADGKNAAYYILVEKIPE
ncbi:MAG: hypothetical protein ACOY3D_05000 [Candidatus Omnitrophota bacterium]